VLLPRPIGNTGGTFAGQNRGYSARAFDPFVLTPIRPIQIQVPDLLPPD